jgi:hypothetical protein
MVSNQLTYSAFFTKVIAEIKTEFNTRLTLIKDRTNQSSRENATRPFKNSMKKISKLTVRKIISASARMLDGLQEPFTAFAANRVLKMFFDKSKPSELLANTLIL